MFIAHSVQTLLIDASHWAGFCCEARHTDCNFPASGPLQSQSGPETENKRLFKIIFCNFSYFRVLGFLARNKHLSLPRDVQKCFVDGLDPQPMEEAIHNQQRCLGLFQLLHQCLHFFFLLNFPHTTSQHVK